MKDIIGKEQYIEEELCKEEIYKIYDVTSINISMNCKSEIPFIL